eukprot:9414659-Pyramimonas_sp.AAC.1
MRGQSITWCVVVVWSQRELPRRRRVVKSGCGLLAAGREPAGRAAEVEGRYWSVRGSVCNMGSSMGAEWPMYME